MKTFIINKIQGLSGFSRKLDILSLLSYNEWVLFNGDKNYSEKYIFEKDNKLLISRNGIITFLEWYFIKINNKIRIDLNQQSYMLNPIIYDNNIIMLQLDGTNQYIFLINPNSNEIKDYNNFKNIQWYLYTKLSLDILTPTERLEFDKRIKEIRLKEQDEAELSDNNLSQIIGAFIIGFIVIISMIIITLLIKN